MNELRPGDDSLTTALRAVAAEDRSRRAAPFVEARLLAEARSIARGRRTRARAAMVAMAAVLFIAIAVPLWPPSSGEVAVDPGRTSDGAALTGEVTTEFFPLTYSSVPASDGQVVRMQVPRAALSRFGVTSFVVSDDPSATVMAEVVVGNDGLARAVRFVRAGTSDQQEQIQ